MKLGRFLATTAFTSCTLPKRGASGDDPLRLRSAIVVVAALGPTGHKVSQAREGFPQDEQLTSLRLYPAEPSLTTPFLVVA